METIIKSNGLYCDSIISINDIGHVGIAHKDIKDKRSRKKLPPGFAGVVADYVPFYFAPRSPMLFSIHKGYVTGYDKGQREIIYLVTSIEAIQNNNLKFVFTDGHPIMDITDFYTDIKDLDKIDWNVMIQEYWNDTVQDNDRCRRRQAEFLVFSFFPWTLVEQVGVINNTMAKRIAIILEKSGHKPKTIIEQKWYY